MEDVLGQAVYDHFKKDFTGKLWIYNKYGPREEMPANVYFRNEDNMPDIEWLAIERCNGKVLDIGAGAGSHALLLQQRSLEVTALDISPLLAEVMHNRGVKNVVLADIFEYNNSRFDTILLLMNGIGLAGTLVRLKQLLLHFKNLLNPDGQILFDSSDVAYLYNSDLPADHYYGEIAYQYAYKGVRSEWFKWLYVDEKTMTGIASDCGFDMEVLLEDEFGQYLARLTPKAGSIT
ncbi:class I SAM-dependent methyltransferase [Mucilaginibacter calamicampi]|uniref:Class I SAM-dependent methyltransferase n=1 Tax=Mucilaginibacter calamicampi TaxID=1302352 RepID=A0ABW2YY73_9SPHI